MAQSNAASFEEVQRLVVDESETVIGHDLMYSFPVNRLVTKETWTFSLDYNTECSQPTLWNFRFFYEKEPETKKITCSVTIKRMDDRAESLYACALVSFMDFEGRVARFTEAVLSGTMLPGEEKQGSISNGDDGELFDRELIVRISITIQQCHVLKG